MSTETADVEESFLILDDTDGGYNIGLTLEEDMLNNDLKLVDCVDNVEEAEMSPLNLNDENKLSEATTDMQESNGEEKHDDEVNELQDTAEATNSVNFIDDESGAEMCTEANKDDEENREIEDQQAVATEEGCSEIEDQQTVPTKEGCNEIMKMETHKDDITEEHRKTGLSSHPYLYLIEDFQLTKEQTTVTNIGPPRSLKETPLSVIYTREELMRLIQDLRNAKEISLDFQFDNRDYEGFVALLEISTREADYIIDAIELKSELLLLTEIFINPKIVKILHRAENIVTCLQQNLHLFIINFFDVEKAALALGLSKKRMSIYTLLRENFSVERNPAMLQAGFRTRPLTDALQEYCRQSAHYLIYIYHDYKNKLLTINESLFKELMVEFRETSKIVYSGHQETSLREMEQEMKKRHSCQLHVLQRLFEWRNSVAKAQNKYPEVIINKGALISIAAHLSYSEASVLSFTNSKYVKDDVEKILSIVSEAKFAYQIYDKKQKQKKKKPSEYKNESNVSKAVYNSPLKRKWSDNLEIGPNKRTRNQSAINNKISPKAPALIKPTFNPTKTSTNKQKRIEYPFKNKPNPNNKASQNQIPSLMSAGSGIVATKNLANNLNHINRNLSLLSKQISKGGNFGRSTPNTNYQKQGGRGRFLNNTSIPRSDILQASHISPINSTFVNNELRFEQPSLKDNVQKYSRFRSPPRSNFSNNGQVGMQGNGFNQSVSDSGDFSKTDDMKRYDRAFNNSRDSSGRFDTNRNQSNPNFSRRFQNSQSGGFAAYSGRIGADSGDLNLIDQKINTLEQSVSHSRYKDNYNDNTGAGLFKRRFY